MSEMAYSQTNDVQDMVLLHGWGANKQIWQAWAEASFPHYRLWLIDLPGHGERDSVQIMPEESLISAWCRDMLSQMPEQAIVLGWSLGGLIAQSIALIYPERVSALILLATSPCFVQKEAWLPALEQQAFDTYLIDLERDPLELFKAFSLLQSLGSSRPKQLSKQLIQEVTTMPAQQDALAQGLTLLG
jgi:pimeloyl-[acyl-carrier protein] methyl ester esterase